MEKTTTYLIPLVFSLLACDDLKIASKDILIKDAPLYIYYEPTSRVMPVEDGLILQFQKSYTNGDEKKCEAIAKTENRIAKVDFDGNILWDKPYTDSSFMAYYQTYDKQYNYYGIEYGGNKLRKFDENLHRIATTQLDFSKYTNKYVSLTAIQYWKDDKIFAYGYVNSVTEGSSNQTYQSFFCLISMQNGIEKFVFIDTENSVQRSSKYKIREDGIIYGYDYDSSLSQNTITFNQFDSNFKHLMSKEIVKAPNISVFASTFQAEKIYLFMGEFDKNKTLLSIDNNFTIKEQLLNTRIDYINFIKNDITENLYFTFSDASSTIYTINNTEIVKIGTFDSYISTPFIRINKGNLHFISIGGGKDYKKNSHIFYKQTLNEPTISKTLYQSQYSRNCNRWMD